MRSSKTIASGCKEKPAELPGLRSRGEAAQLCACQSTIAGHVDYCAMHAEAPALLKALKAMAESHGMHGPCRHNNCRDCVAAYNAANALIDKMEGGRT